MIFIAHENEEVFLPEKELREFIKVDLQPGVTKEINLVLDTSSLGYYNTLISDWYADGGIYQIQVGPSLTDCKLKADLIIISPEKPQPDYRSTAPAYYNLPKGQFEIADSEFEALYGRKLPISDNKPGRPFHADNTLEDVKHTLVGKIINLYADSLAKKVTKSEDEQVGMMAAMMKEMPFHSMVASGDGMISESMMEGILDLLNHHYVRGIRKLLK
jgi:beta-glucosidase